MNYFVTYNILTVRTGSILRENTQARNSDTVQYLISLRSKTITVFLGSFKIPKKNNNNTGNNDD